MAKASTSYKPGENKFSIGLWHCGSCGRYVKREECEEHPSGRFYHDFCHKQVQIWPRTETSHKPLKKLKGEKHKVFSRWSRKPWP